MGGKYCRRQNGTLRPHGGDDGQSNGKGTFSHAGDVLNGDNSFHDGRILLLVCVVLYPYFAGNIPWNRLFTREKIVWLILFPGEIPLFEGMRLSFS
jgi:hypothetical protein